MAQVCKDCYGILDKELEGANCICVSIEPVEVKKKDSDYCGAV